MLETLLETLLAETQKISRAQTVIGDAVQVGTASVVPICRVQIGFGVGGTGNGSNGQSAVKFSGTGSGGGIRIEPIACIAVDQNGRVQLLQLSGEDSSTAGKIIDLVPQVLDRLGLTPESAKNAVEKKISGKKSLTNAKETDPSSDNS